MATPALTCLAALREATRRWPDRNKASDGIMGDAAHQARVSDHNEGNAWDLTHDPAHDVDTWLLADLMRRHPDSRVKYVISNHRIWNPSISPDWRTYVGPDPHTGHMHVSIQTWARDNTDPWFWFLDFPEDDVKPTLTYVDADEDGAVVTFMGKAVNYDAVCGYWPTAPGGTWWVMRGIDGHAAVAYAIPPLRIDVAFVA